MWTSLISNRAVSVRGRGHFSIGIDAFPRVGRHVLPHNAIRLGGTIRFRETAHKLAADWDDWRQA